MRETTGERRAAWLFLFVLGLALALRLWRGLGASLWLDELHSLHQAGADTLPALFEGLSRDNHPPLHFLVLRGFRAVLGDSELALRLPSMIFALAAIGVLWRLATGVLDTRGRAAAAIALAVSSLHVVGGAEARMYALLALAVVGLIDGLVALLDRRGGAWRVFVWTAIGLHTHYWFLHALAVLVPVTAYLVLRWARYRSAARPLALGLLGGVLVALPWYLTVFLDQLAHKLPPGSSAVDPLRFFEALVHLQFFDLSLGGVLLRPAFLFCGAAGLALALTGVAGLVLGVREHGRPATVALATAGAFLAPAFACAVAAVFPHAGFNWQYLAGSTAPFALLLGAEASARGFLAPLRRAVVWIVLVGSGVLAGLNAAHPGHDDYRAGVRVVLAQSEPG
ncbi:MAG: glycosyltransferase family 39 protein, partial [Planctomycetota bacterium]|nr:glycosyltransferase family 39 protein [Planctomycetota bacterium]